MPGVSIIVPTRDEQDNIDPLLRRLLPVVMPEGRDREIIFVDDSSSDATRDRIRPWSDTEPVRLICREGRGGLASAVIAGAKEARYDIVVVLDADLSHPPETIPELVQPLLDRTHDMVIGSRYVDGGKIPQWPLARKIASRLACLPARLFSAVNDPMAGYFATDRDRLAAAGPDVPGFKIGFELLATAEDGFRVKEIPIVFSDRFEGFSKMNPSIIRDYAQQLLQLCGCLTPACNPLRLGMLASGAALLNLVCFMLFTRGGMVPVIAHLGSFALSGTALVALFRIKRNKLEQPGGLSLLQGASVLVAAVISVAVQGAVFRIMCSYGEILPDVTYLLAALIGMILLTVPLSIIFASAFHRLAVRVRLRFAAVGTIVALILLRFFYLGVVELMEQEAYYWNYSQHPALSYLDHPPLTAFLIRLGTGMFGTDEFGVRIGAFVCWIIAAVYLHRLTSRLCGRTAALGSVMLLAVLPYYFGIGMMMTPDASLHAAWAAVLYYLYRALVEGRSDAWLGVGIAFGVGLLSKYTIALLGPAALLFMLADRRSRGWLVRAEPIGAVLLAFLLFLPVLIWNYQHEWISFLFQSQDRLSGQKVFTTHRLLGYIAVNLTPVGLFCLYYFFFRGRSLIVTFSQGATDIDANEARRRYLFLLVMTVVPLAVFSLFSLTREVKLNWTSPLWLAALPILGGLAMSCDSTRPYRSMLLQRCWQWTVVLLVVVYAAALHYTALGIPGLPYPSRPFLAGWQNFAAQIESILDDVELETGSRPVVVGMDPYQISSGLAFYRAKNANGLPPDIRRRRIDETVGWHLFTWDGLMYEFWANPDDFAGKDVLVVATSRIRVEYPYFRNRMTSLGPIQQLQISKSGSPVRTMYYRLVRGYRPGEDR